VFPPGLAVGKVIKAVVLEASAYQRAIVQPVIDYDRVEDVFVIKKDPDKAFMEIFSHRNDE
jgi:cell shape-determining protein MreC